MLKRYILAFFCVMSMLAMNIDALLYRSIFFHLGLKFKKPYPSVLDASKNRGVDIRILVPDQISQDTAFLYQLRFSDKNKAHEVEYNGAKLDRFVYQSMNDNEVSG